jgi:peptidoglycan/xylan/chitin deacetylase (PgdA/CDA1 family)
MNFPLADITGLTAPAALCGLAWAAMAAHGTFVPDSRFWGPVISRASADGPRRVALTFDDGPTAGSTERILDTLGELDVRAAFFVVGRNVERWPRLVERMDAEGHVVANHSWDHGRYGVFRRIRYWTRQIARTAELIEQIIGRRPALFRPPMGMKTWHVTDAARATGHAVVTWNRSAFDGVATSSGRIVERLAGPAMRGDILLLHDGVEPHAPSCDTAATEGAVRPLVAALREKGLTPRRLDELLGIPAYQKPDRIERRMAPVASSPLRRAA